MDQPEARHPGLRALVENLLRRRVRQGEIARRVYKRFGARLSHQSLSTYFRSRIQPEEFAAAEAYRQAHAQARALLEEMKADPALDAAQIAELLLAQQIFKHRAKLGAADILDLYKAHRGRRKLQPQRQALRLREKQTKAVLKKISPPRQPPLSGAELAAKIEEIYGLSNPPGISNA